MWSGADHQYLCSDPQSSGWTREAKQYQSRQPIPSPGDLPNPGIELGAPALQADSLPAQLSGIPNVCVYIYVFMWVYSCTYTEYVCICLDDPWKDTKDTGNNCCLLQRSQGREGRLKIFIILCYLKFFCISKCYISKVYTNILTNNLLSYSNNKKSTI